MNSSGRFIDISSFLFLFVSKRNKKRSKRKRKDKGINFSGISFLFLAVQICPQRECKFVEKTTFCHCTPDRNLVWQSVSFLLSLRTSPQTGVAIRFSFIIPVRNHKDLSIEDSSILQFYSFSFDSIPLFAFPALLQKQHQLSLHNKPAYKCHILL